MQKCPQILSIGFQQPLLAGSQQGMRECPLEKQSIPCFCFFLFGFGTPQNGFISNTRTRCHSLPEHRALDPAQAAGRSPTAARATSRMGKRHTCALVFIGAWGGGGRGGEGAAGREGEGRERRERRGGRGREGAVGREGGRELDIDMDGGEIHLASRTTSETQWILIRFPNVNAIQL